MTPYITKALIFMNGLTAGKDVEVLTKVSVKIEFNNKVTQQEIMDDCQTS